MGIIGKGGLTVTGIILIALGFLIKSGLLERLLEFTGWIIISIGTIVAIVGVVGLATGRKGGSGGF